MSHYDTLGVTKDADAETIKKAYRRKSRQHHPDRGGDARAMVSVNRAYDTLSDPGKRERYDLGGGDSPPPPPADTAALQIIWQILSQVIDRVEDQYDFIDSTRKQIKANISTVKGQRAQMARTIRKYEKQMKRVRRKKGDGENLIIRVWEQRLVQIKEAMRQADEQMHWAQRSLEILDEYESPCEDGEAPQHVQGILEVLFTAASSG